jgi:hypothetical protein
MDGMPAKMFNPGGFTLGDAIRSLRESGYSDADITRLIKIVGTDTWGKPMWRWRTEHPLPDGGPSLRV